VTVRQTSHDVEGTVFDMDSFAVHDGPGIRLAVYLKGCPLSCEWCHSPESQQRHPELIFVRDRCLACGACADACTRGVHTVDGGEHSLLRSSCEVCGRCVGACPTGALGTVGYRIAASEVVSKAARMSPFFAHSQGGITLSGGEVSGQASFAEQVLRGCQALGVHTAIETSGACDWEPLGRLVPHTDLVLYDLKLIDSDAHRRWTGASNRQILENASRLPGCKTQVRVPLIPGITDTDQNLSEIYSFAAEAGLRNVALLPYNPSAAAKYEWLGQSYALSGEVQPPDRLEELVRMGCQLGLHVSFG